MMFEPGSFKISILHFEEPNDENPNFKKVIQKTRIFITYTEN